MQHHDILHDSLRRKFQTFILKLTELNGGNAGDVISVLFPFPHLMSQNIFRDNRTKCNTESVKMCFSVKTFIKTSSDGLSNRPTSLSSSGVLS